MELIIKNKFFSPAGSSVVLNEKNEQVYLVKGSWASNTFTKKYAKTIKDMSGKVFYKVCNKRLHALTRACFVYDANNNQVAIIKEALAISAQMNFEIEGTAEPMTIKGYFMSEEGAKITVGDKVIGKVTPANLKKLGAGYVTTNVTDQFRVVFDDPEDAPFLVALVVAIDNIKDAHQRAANQHINH